MNKKILSNDLHRVYCQKRWPKFPDLEQVITWTVDFEENRWKSSVIITGACQRTRSCMMVFRLGWEISAMWNEIAMKESEIISIETILTKCDRQGRHSWAKPISQFRSISVKKNNCFLLKTLKQGQKVSSAQRIWMPFV